MFTFTAALLALAASSSALPQEYGLARRAPAVHKIVVGGPNGELTYNPNAIFANVGDVVTFEFHQKNHSAVQSSLAAPCGQVEGGFNSGFFPVDAGVTSGFPQWNYTVADTKPVWVYCAQGAGLHCSKGMVFAINCGKDGAANSFAAFQKAAEATTPSTAAPVPPSSAAPVPSPSATDVGTPDGTPDTTSFPGVTIPPAPVPTEVTKTVVVGTSTWTTTYASYPNSPDPTPSSLTGSVINVVVGENGTLTFTPPFVVAKPRDTIVFEFQTKNHTLTQSSFEDPCRKLSLTSNVTDIFDSGFMPVAAGSTAFPTFNLTVNDTAPTWAYCRQVGHCGQGMVFAINPDQSSARSFSAFQTLAIDINGTAAPGSSAPGAAPGGNSAGRVGASAALGLASVMLGALLL